MTDLESEGTAPAGPGDQSDGPAAAGLFTDVPGEPSADPHDAILAQLTSVPVEKLAAHLEKNPDLKKAALKDIRQRDIDLRAEQRAAEMAQADREDAARSRAMLGQLAIARERERLSTMTDEEQRAHVGNLGQQMVQHRAQSAEQRAQAAEQYVENIENRRAQELLIAHFADEAQLDDEDKAALRQTRDRDEFQAVLLKRVAAREKARAARNTSQDERYAAQERRDSGASTFAATSGSSSGGELSMADLEARYATMSTRNPDWQRIDREYRERKEQGRR